MSLDKLEGKGFFTKEIEDELLNHSIDIAVHSYKDLATTLPDGLRIAAITEREQANDLLLATHPMIGVKDLTQLKPGARVGTSSLRRKAMLRYYRPDLDLVDLRGNVPTRIQKLRNGLDAIVIAQAGVRRINPDTEGLSSVILPLDFFVPAPAQGALAIQMREDDSAIAKVGLLNHRPTEVCTTAERRVLQLLGGGCHLPLGVYVEWVDDEFIAQVFYAPPAGKSRFFCARSVSDTLLPGVIMAKFNE